MTTKVYKIGFVLILSLLSIAYEAIGQSVISKSKEVKKTYNLSKNTRLEIDNKYGDIHINTWDQKRIDVKVTITADKRSASRAQELLDRVQIEIDGDENSSNIAFRTKIVGNINNSNNEKLTINYDVNMPKTSPVELTNKYGNLYLGNLNALAEIDVSYGNIKVDQVNASADIELSYGSGEIESLGNANIDISYSNLYLNRAGDVDMDSRYSNLDLGDLGVLEISNRYGDLQLKSVRSIEGDIKYSKVQIGELTDFLDLDLSYGGGLTIDKIGKNFSRVIIDSEYVTSHLTFEAGTNAMVIAHASYGSIKYDKNQINFNYVSTSNNSSDYKGRMGTSGNPKSEVNVDTRYGSVILNIR